MTSLFLPLSLSRWWVSSLFLRGACFLLCGGALMGMQESYGTSAHQTEEGSQESVYLFETNKGEGSRGFQEGRTLHRVRAGFMRVSGVTLRGLGWLLLFVVVVLLLPDEQEGEEPAKGKAKKKTRPGARKKQGKATSGKKGSGRAKKHTKKGGA